MTVNKTQKMNRPVEANTFGRSAFFRRADFVLSYIEDVVEAFLVILSLLGTSFIGVTVERQSVGVRLEPRTCIPREIPTI